MKALEESQRHSLVHLVRSSKTPEEAAQELGKCRSWAYKWWGRYQKDGWSGLKERPRAPKHQPNRLSEAVRQAICRVRSELEAEAQIPDKLSYIGAYAIHARLRKEKIVPLPGISTIEQVLREAGMTKPRTLKVEHEVVYPHLCPAAAHQLTQVDIVPHYLAGGTSIACFNGIDVVSRYPAGKQYDCKSAGEALDFLVHLWQELGISEYTQMDNEGCFSGGFTHPGVVGRATRLALLVGTQPAFSPFYHPESNGTVERFHQDYSDNVWEKVQLGNLLDVRRHSASFFPRYRHSQHHSALQGQSPAALHFATALRKLPANFKIPEHLPITEGKVHFMRAVSADRKVSIANQHWDVALAHPAQGVWATLHITLKGARLRIYDAAPDAPARRCLAEHPFPLKEPVVPLNPAFRPATPKPSWFQILASLFVRPAQAESTMF